MRADTGRVLKKKKTTFQKLATTNGENPVFNETLVFDMPPNELIQTVVLALVCFANRPPGVKHHISDAATAGIRMPFKQPQTYYDESALFHFAGNLNNTQGTGNESPRTGGGNSTGNNSNDGQRVSDPVPGPSSSSNSPEDEICKVTKVSEGRHKPPKLPKEKDVVVGKVAFGCCVKNPIGRFHWEKMVLHPRTVVNEWHYLK